MSYLEDNKEVEFGRPKNPRNQWRRQAKREERKRNRQAGKSGRSKNNDNPLRDWINICRSNKACHANHGKTPGKLARQRKRANRKRDRYWG